MKWSSSEIRFNTNAGRQQGGCRAAQQHALAAPQAALLQLASSPACWFSSLPAHLDKGLRLNKCGGMLFAMQLC